MVSVITCFQSPLHPSSTPRITPLCSPRHVSHQIHRGFTRVRAPNTVTSRRQLLTPGVPGGYWWQKAGGGRRRPAPSRCTNSPGVLGCQGSTLLPTYHHCTDSHSFTIAEKRLTLSQLCVALLFPQDFWRPADLVSQALQ